MGDRANILLKYSDGNKIFFYSHWGGNSLLKTLKEALKRGKDRWDDESYLARIVFSEMIKDEIMDNTGYGISPYDIDGVLVAVVDLENHTVNDELFESFIK